MRFIGTSSFSFTVIIILFFPLSVKEHPVSHPLFSRKIRPVRAAECAHGIRHGSRVQIRTLCGRKGAFLKSFETRKGSKCSVPLSFNLHFMV